MRLIPLSLISNFLYSTKERILKFKLPILIINIKIIDFNTIIKRSKCNFHKLKKLNYKNETFIIKKSKFLDFNILKHKKIMKNFEFTKLKKLKFKKYNYIDKELELINGDIIKRKKNINFKYDKYLNLYNIGSNFSQKSDLNPENRNNIELKINLYNFREYTAFLFFLKSKYKLKTYYNKKDSLFLIIESFSEKKPYNIINIKKFYISKRSEKNVREYLIKNYT